VSPADFARFDLVLAMDRPVLQTLERLRSFSHGGAAELALFLDFHPERAGQDVRDPYYGNDEDFALVLRLAEEGSTALLRHLLKRKGVFGCGC